MPILHIRKLYHSCVSAGAQEAAFFNRLVQEEDGLARLLMLTISGDVAIVFRHSPGCEQGVLRGAMLM